MPPKPPALLHKCVVSETGSTSRQSRTQAHARAEWPRALCNAPRASVASVVGGAGAVIVACQAFNVTAKVAACRRHRDTLKSDGRRGFVRGWLAQAGRAEGSASGRARDGTDRTARGWPWRALTHRHGWIGLCRRGLHAGHRGQPHQTRQGAQTGHRHSHRRSARRQTCALFRPSCSARQILQRRRLRAAAPAPGRRLRQRTSASPQAQFAARCVRRSPQRQPGAAPPRRTAPHSARASPAFGCELEMMLRICPMNALVSSLSSPLAMARRAKWLNTLCFLCLA